MSIIFYIVCILGFIYFFINKRTFDFFSIAYVSSMVYFLPGFFGTTFLPGWIITDLLMETYFIMCLIPVSIVITAIIYDYYNVSDEHIIKYDFQNSEYTYIMINIITIVSFIMMMLTMGSSLFLADKKEMMLEINSWSKIWENAVCIGIVLAYLNNNKKSFLVYLAMIAFIIYTGDRTIPAIALISIMTIVFNSQGKQSILFKRFKLVSISVLFALFFFVYKYLYIHIKLKMWTEVFEKLTNPYFYLETVKFSEPFAIQTILNETIKHDFYVGMGHFTGLLNQLVPFGNRLGATSVTFNNLFQQQLFPEVTYGMGSNIWAEMLSAGGWGLLFIFVLLFNMVLYVGNGLFRKSYGNFRVLMVILLSFWSFYIHRSSLEYTINLNKRIILLLLISYMFSALVGYALKNKTHNKLVKS